MLDPVLKDYMIISEFQFLCVWNEKHNYYAFLVGLLWESNELNGASYVHKTQNKAAIIVIISYRKTKGEYKWVGRYTSLFSSC